MIDVGDYTIGLNGPGMVDHAGVHLATGSATVSAGLVSTETMTYDYAATVTASIETYQPGKTTATGNNIASVASRVSAVNGDDLTILRNEPLAGPASSPVAGFTVGSLFPFSAPYSFFTGTCRYSNPTTDSANSGYFGSYPGAVATTPGGTHTVIVRQPPINFQMARERSSTSAPPDGTRVVATPVRPTGDGCVEPSIELKTFTVNGTAGVVGRSQPNSNYVEAGVPFGYYKICFERLTTMRRTTIWPDDYAGDPNAVSYGGILSYDNTDPLGRTARVSIDASNTAKWHDNSSCQVTS
jgi:hypothetical protein